MASAVREFFALAKRRHRAKFSVFYSGHGIRVDAGQVRGLPDSARATCPLPTGSYLVGVDASAGCREASFRDAVLGVGELQRIARKARQSFIVLDTCLAGLFRGALVPETARGATFEGGQFILTSTADFDLARDESMFFDLFIQATSTASRARSGITARSIGAHILANYPRDHPQFPQFRCLDTRNGVDCTRSDIPLFSRTTTTSEPRAHRGTGVPRVRDQIVFTHCPFGCPEMVTLRDRAVAVSKYEVTYEEWDATCVLGGCGLPPDHGRGRGRRPVTEVSPPDVRDFLRALSRRTGRDYRLLTSEEFRSLAQHGMDGRRGAVCRGCGSRWDGRFAAPADASPPNAVGLHNLLGNAWEWVCAEPSPEATGRCDTYELRGGSHDTRRDALSPDLVVSPTLLAEHARWRGCGPRIGFEGTTAVSDCFPLRFDHVGFRVALDCEAHECLD